MHAAGCRQRNPHRRRDDGEPAQAQEQLGRVGQLQRRFRLQVLHVDVRLVEAVEEHQTVGAGLPTEAWLARAWTVKEAAAKAAGTGLQGRPRDFVIREIDGDEPGPANPGQGWEETNDEPAQGEGGQESV